MTGSPMVIINNGVIDQRKMKKLRLNIDDLMEELRTNNIFNIEDVYYAIVETTGKVSVMLKYKAQTVTPEMLQLKGSDPQIPSVVVSDRIVLEMPSNPVILEETGWNKRSKKIVLASAIFFLMTADANANYYIVPKQTMEKQNNG